VTDGRVQRMVLIAAHVAVIRTLYRSLRCRGWCIVARGTKLKISSRARIELAPGSRLYLGFGLASFTGSPISSSASRRVASIVSPARACPVTATSSAPGQVSLPKERR